jgi:hypothetical protein
VGSAQKRLDATAESGPVSYEGRHRLFPLEPALPDAPDGKLLSIRPFFNTLVLILVMLESLPMTNTTFSSSSAIFLHLPHGPWHHHADVEHLASHQTVSRIRSAKSGTGNGPDPSSGLDKCACAPCSPQGLCSGARAHRCACSICALGFVQCLPSSTPTTSSVEHSTTQGLRSAHHQSRTRVQNSAIECWRVVTFPASIFPLTEVVSMPNLSALRRNKNWGNLRILNLPWGSYTFRKRGPCGSTQREVPHALQR